MSDRIFQYRAAGSSPGMFVIDVTNGVVRVSMRGEPSLHQEENDQEGLHTVVVPGQLATLALPGEEAAALAIALLSVPPAAELVGKIPYVCWFDTTANRDQFVQEVRQHLDPREVEVRRPGS